MSSVKDCLTGDVYLIHLDGSLTTDPKPTILICVCAHSFFAVHKLKMLTDNLTIKKSDHKFLAYDSHVKCGVVLELPSNTSVIKEYGSITNGFLSELIEAVDNAEGLTPIEKRPILESLRKLQLQRNKNQGFSKT